MTAVGAEHGRLPRLEPVGRHPAGDRPVVLLLHGGRPVSRERTGRRRLPYYRMVPFARMLAAAGARAYLVRYRFRGWNGPARDPVRDVEWAVVEVGRRHPGAPIVLVGHSMGGRAAIGAAGGDGVVAVCALAPWLEESDPVAQLEGRSLLIAHGDRETWTDPVASFDLAVRAKDVTDRTCRFELHGAGHFMLSRRADWRALVRRFVLGELGIEPEDPVIAEAMRRPTPRGLRVPLSPREEVRGGVRLRATGSQLPRPGPDVCGSGGEPPVAPARVTSTGGPGVGSKIAVVGAGVAGLTAAHVLQKHHDVVLFESDDRLGGHAHTHELAASDGETAFVDSGFIVHNDRTYPRLLRLFAELGVATQGAEMSMSVRCDGCGLEYAGARGPSGLFPQVSAAARPAYVRMLGEVLRFHRHARRVLDDEGADDVPLGDFLAAGGYSRYFVEHFAIPVVSAVWSAGPAVSLAYPARYLFTFLRHHGMLSVSGSPQWRTVVGGSRSYVERVAKGLHAVHVSTPVRVLRRLTDGVEVRDDADDAHRFDKVVVATHPDQALALLAAPTDAERALLGAFSYSRNETWLHGDMSVLPRRSRARASWNYLKPACASADGPVLVSYDMNRLQRLTEPDDYVVTLNGATRVDASRVVARMTYEHPIYTPASVAAQNRLPELNDGTVAYAGAYHGWGFHEDGCASGVRAAESLGSVW